MLKMCLLLLGVLSSVTACGPQYQTVYDYQPPQSKDGLACIRQCSINQTDNNACNLSHRTKKDIKRLHSPSPAQEPEEPTLEEHIELYSEKCSMQCGCDDSYRTCYQGCGGNINSREVCIDNCPNER